MNKIQMLISQIDCVNELVITTIQNERVVLCNQHFTKLVQIHQKVSLTEKIFNVKNVRSHISS